MISRAQFSKHGPIDKELQQQLENAAGYWKRVLERVFKTILSTTSRVIGLWGHDEHLEAPNPGNFLRTIKLLAEFDPLLKDLLNDTNKTVKYLSPIIQNEVVEILSTGIRKLSCDEIVSVPFFQLLLIQPLM